MELKLEIYSLFLDKFRTINLRYIFFKAIHFGGEDGFFFYFDYINEIGPYPIILVKHRKEDNIIEDFDKFNKKK